MRSDGETVEKCGRKMPREVLAGPAIRVGETDGKVINI